MLTTCGVASAIADPTGATLSQGELEEVVGTCKEVGAHLFSDEMYRGLGEGLILRA